jgi:hypothetical protein
MATARKTGKSGAATATPNSSTGSVVVKSGSREAVRTRPERPVRLPMCLFFLAIAMTVCVPFAYSAHSGGNSGGSDSSSGYQDPEIPGLVYGDVLAAAQRVLPAADKTQHTYGGTHATYLDNSSSTDGLLSGGIDIYTNDSGDSALVTRVTCDVDSVAGADSPIIQFCTSLSYTGADPIATTAWMHSFFDTPTPGATLSQDRAAASWSLSINQYKPVIFDFNVSMGGPY